MRTLTRRGFMAGAMALIAPVAGSTPVFADQASDATDSIRTRTGPSSPAQTDDSGRFVEERAHAAAPTEPSAEQKQAALGQTIVDFALSYYGYPYVAAGNSPAGFDCSGFTQFVYLNVLGIDIGHGVEGQPAAGAWVDWGNWMPGDLIVFQNTYKAGISHVAIYIGDGQIVHAENEGTGVTVSSIYSAYYSARYWGAVRLI
ncbi:MAG TPA: C40 family peptidase [Thermomicrobiales bacterium]|nr:C40 family peptidase [Thermomicrobiales bacterium]